MTRHTLTASPRTAQAAQNDPSLSSSEKVATVDHSLNDLIAQYGKLSPTSRVHSFVAQRLQTLLKDSTLKEPPELVILGRKGLGINAMATSCGAIVLTPEIISFLKYTEELDFVLLHEAAHISGDHIKGIHEAMGSGGLRRAGGRARLSEYEADMQAFLALAHPDRDSSPMGAILALERVNAHRGGAWDIAHGAGIDRIMNLKTCAIFRDLSTEGAIPDEAGSMSKQLRTIPLMVKKDIEGLQSGNRVYTLIKQPRLDGNIYKYFESVIEAIKSADIPSIRCVIPELCAQIAEQKARISWIPSSSRAKQRLDCQNDIAELVVSKLIRSVSERGQARALSPNATERLLGLELLLAGMTLDKADSILTRNTQQITSRALTWFPKRLTSRDALTELQHELSLIEGSIQLEQARELLHVVAEGVLAETFIFEDTGDDSIDIRAYLTTFSDFIDRLAPSTFSQIETDSEISDVLKAESFLILTRYLISSQSSRLDEVVTTASELKAPYILEPSILSAALQTVVRRTTENDIADKLEAFARTGLALPEVRTSLAKIRALFRQTAPLVAQISSPDQANAALDTIQDRFKEAYQIAKNLPNSISSSLASEADNDDGVQLPPRNRMIVIQSLLDEELSLPIVRGQAPSFEHASRLFLLKVGLLQAISVDQSDRDEITMTMRLDPEVKVPSFEKLIELVDEVQSERPESLIRGEPLPPRHTDQRLETALHDASFERLAEELLDSANPLTHEEVLKRLTTFATRSLIPTPAEGDGPQGVARYFQILELGARALRETYPTDRSSEQFLLDALAVSFFIPNQGPARLIQRELVLRLIDSAGSERVTRHLFESFRHQRGWISLEALEKLDETAHTVGEIKTVARLSKEHALAPDKIADQAGTGVVLDYFFSERVRHNFNDILFRGLTSASDDSALTKSIVEPWWSCFGDDLRTELSDTLFPLKDGTISREQAQEIVEQIRALTPGTISGTAINYLMGTLKSADAVTPNLIRSSMYCLSIVERLVVLRKLANDPARGTLISPEKRVTVAEGLLNMMLSGSSSDKLTAISSQAFRALFRAVPADDLGIALTPMLLDQFLKAPPVSADFRPFAAGYAKDLLSDYFVKPTQDPGAIVPEKRPTLPAGARQELLDEVTNHLEWALSGRNPRTELSVSQGTDELMEICDITLADPVALTRRGPIPFILDFSRNLQTPGTRALQLLGGIVELPPSVEKEFLEVYDARRGQSKHGALRTIEKILPDYASQVTTLRRIGGGALYSVFIADLSSGGREVIRVANPNPEYHTRRILHSMRAAQEQLEREDSEFKIGRHVINLVDEWISTELRDSSFESDDKAFRKSWHRWKPHHKCPLFIYIPESSPTGSLHVRREEFIPGRNFTELQQIYQESPELARAAVSLALQHYMKQVRGNLLPFGETLVHSDISPGNLRLMEGGKVALLDRSMYLKFSVQDRLLLQQLRKASSHEARAEALVTGLASMQSEQIPPEDLLRITNDVAYALKSSDSVEKTLLKGLLTAQQGGLMVPLRFQLLVKNLNSFRVMAAQVGFANLNEALEHDWR